MIVVSINNHNTRAEVETRIKFLTDSGEDYTFMVEGHPYSVQYWDIETGISKVHGFLEKIVNKDNDVDSAYIIMQPYVDHRTGIYPRKVSIPVLNIKSVTIRTKKEVSTVIQQISADFVYALSINLKLLHSDPDKSITELNLLKGSKYIVSHVNAKNELETFTGILTKITEVKPSDINNTNAYNNAILVETGMFNNPYTTGSINSPILATDAVLEFDVSTTAETKITVIRLSSIRGVEHDFTDIDPDYHHVVELGDGTVIDYNMDTGIATVGDTQINFLDLVMNALGKNTGEVVPDGIEEGIVTP